MLRTTKSLALPKPRYFTEFILSAVEGLKMAMIDHNVGFRRTFLTFFRNFDTFNPKGEPVS